MLSGTPKKRGGWRGNPASLVALVPTQFPAQAYRRCLKCRRNAAKASQLCRWHGRKGSPWLPGRTESGTLTRLYRLGLIPVELMTLSSWRDLATVHVSLRAPARLALVMLWGRREREPLAWGRAWRVALELRAYRREGVRQWDAS